MISAAMPSATNSASTAHSAWALEALFPSKAPRLTVPWRRRHRRIRHRRSFVFEVLREESLSFIRAASQDFLRQGNIWDGQTGHQFQYPRLDRERRQGQPIAAAIAETIFGGSPHRRASEARPAAAVRRAKRLFSR